MASSPCSRWRNGGGSSQREYRARLWQPRSLRRGWDVVSSLARTIVLPSLDGRGNLVVLARAPGREGEVMGWFLRKSFRFGPLRLNLSKRGIGASVGVKGARLGGDATGKPYAAGGRYGLYFRERLGASRTGQTAPELGASGQDQTPHPRGRRWWVLIVLALLIGIILGVVLARAGEPTGVDLFDAQGVRTGYAVVDRDTGRVDFYDPMSRHTGYGRVDGAGKVERFLLL